MKPGDVVGVVLAAGEGRRFGGYKALAPFDGSTLLGAALAALRGAGVGDELVVGNPGWPAGEATSVLAGAELVLNPGWAEGMGSSLRLALGEEAVGAARAVVVMLADTPLVGAECVRRVVAAADGPRALVQATYDGRRGHPVLLGREHWAGVRETAAGDAGARAYLAAHGDQVRLVECGDVGRAYDVDTREDLERLRDRR